MKKKKKYGQHFLTNKQVIREIVNYNDLTDIVVIEIGPGSGVLTEELAKICKYVYAFEIDTDLKPYLDKIANNYNNVEFLYKDILTVELDKFHFDNKIEFSALVANIPYYITAPILMLMLNTKQFETATIMMQKEVGERISSTSGKSYNDLSVLLQTYFNVNKVKTVSKKHFNPPPKVDSIILNFSRKNDYLKLIKNEDNYKEFIRVSFAQKRKTFLNNLTEGFGLDKSVVLEKILKINPLFNPLTRAENMTINDFILYSNGWYND